VLNQRDAKTFYVGVTYCGGSVEEAKELVDKVKDYTNLFVLQSGSLMGDVLAMEEIGDYVVASNMSYAVMGSVYDYVGLNRQVLSSWLIEAKGKWGEQFVGVYYNDEPGGGMLDGVVNLENVPFLKEGRFTPDPILAKGVDGLIVHYIYDKNYNLEAIRAYHPDGTCFVDKGVQGGDQVTYFPNGTINVYEPNQADPEKSNFYVSENITQYTKSIQSREEFLKLNPIQNYDDAARAYVNMHKDLLEGINKKQLNKKDILVFTSDYGLYWWDFKGGYDLVLAELAWNHSDVQQIGLVRGAAKLQGKSWGTILTWKYTHSPYLADGVEMFEQMKTSYEAGAEYVIIFNYSEDPGNPNTLQEEHFQALEHFWSEVVQNTEVVQGGIKAEAVLVLPKNYGWGIRHPNDNIWGLWPADDKSQEVGSQIQSKISKYELKLDIVFEDAHTFVEGKYAHIHYWDQRIPTIIIALVILAIFSLITLSLIVYKLVNKKHKNNNKMKT
jgi:hypothetical protein